MWVLVVAILINGEWISQHHGPFATEYDCEQAHLRIMMHVTNTGLKAKGDCGLRL